MESLYKEVIKDIKKMVTQYAFQNTTETDIIRNLKLLYYDNIKNKNISYDAYLKATIYVVLLASLR